MSDAAQKDLAKQMTTIAAQGKAITSFGKVLMATAGPTILSKTTSEALRKLGELADPTKMLGENLSKLETAISPPINTLFRKASTNFQGALVDGINKALATPTDDKALERWKKNIEAAGVTGLAAAFGDPTTLGAAIDLFAKALTAAATKAANPDTIGNIESDQ